MYRVGKIEALLLAGFFGFVILLYVAYTKPVALNNVTLGDLSQIGIIVKVGAVLSIAGLLAFFQGIPGSLKNTMRNICRLIYAAGFAVASFCSGSGSGWQCFVS